MHRISILLLSAVLLTGCGASKSIPSATEQAVTTTLDLATVASDRIQVSLDPGAFDRDTVRFLIPKTVPGTYSIDDYGQFISEVKAFDYKGDPMPVSQSDVNTWVIPNATSLDRITYYVDDSYDSEGTGSNEVFSPAGTNILANTHFMLNMHGFVGYFEGYTEVPYEVILLTPGNLKPHTSLSPMDSETGSYSFRASRYFEVIDNPIQVTSQEAASISLDDITVNLSVYSPTGRYKAEDLRSFTEKMMKAQKAFLGEIDGTRQYTILLYLSTLQGDAGGFGALEHHTSTVVVLPEMMPADQLEETMIDVVSHEFFHILTPLNVHSEEIQYFDYNDPKMSEHLWMYEGATEYFANLFQIHQGLIDETEFYRRIADKIQSSLAYDDRMSFTEMSRNVLEEPYASNYANVYQKGALINMALDIRLRQLSGGATGVLDLMKKLSQKYDKDTPFKDPELFDEIVALTYPEVRSFFETYVIGNTPIPYETFLREVGLSMEGREVPCSFLLDGEIPFIDANPNEGSIFVREGIALNTSMQALGLQGGDVITHINGQEVNLQTIGGVFGETMSWTPETPVVVEILREGEALRLEGKAGTPTVQQKGIMPLEDASPGQVSLRNAWLKG